MKIGIYNANLHTMGGGEKHIGVVAEFLSKKHDVEFICSLDVDKELLSKKLNLDLSRVGIRAVGLPHDDPEYARISTEYDFFINCTYLSTLKNQCKKSAMLVWFPRIWVKRYPTWIKYYSYKILNNEIFKAIRRKVIPVKGPSQDPITSFYKAQERFVKEREYIRTYDLFIANSKYTQKWIKRELDVESEILYPPIDVDEFLPGEKENIVLSVGRFFIHSHNKKQLEMIKIYKKMYQESDSMKKFEYHLCGGVEDDKPSMDYLNQCKKEAEGFPIFIHENISFNDLKSIYSKTKIFWHASGLDEDPEKSPDKFEHFGMTTVEAMSAGAVPIVIARGGQVEIVHNGENGFLWLTPDELINNTIKVAENEDLRKKIAKQAIISSKKYSKANMYLQLKIILNKLNINV